MLGKNSAGSGDGREVVVTRSREAEYGRTEGVTNETHIKVPGWLKEELYRSKKYYADAIHSDLTPPG